MICPFLGEPTGQRTKVACPAWGDDREVFALVYRCKCPELAPEGRSAVCLPAWPGPWKLPRDQSLADFYELCQTCNFSPEKNPS